MDITIEKIKARMKELNMTQQELADELSITYDYMRKVLCGATKLSAQLSSHIALLLDMRKEQMVMYKVKIPDYILEKWAPGFEKLSKKERITTVRMIVKDALDQLKELGEAYLKYPDEVVSGFMAADTPDDEQ